MNTLLILLAAATAATPADTLSLDEVVVTAAIHPHHDIIAPATLRDDELRSLAAHNVADAIRYFSGAQIKDYGGVGGVKTIDIRSMGSNHLGVAYDGIQLGNAQNGQIDLGKYSLDNIEAISLYNGQKSDIFQPARDFGPASTIYLRTRRPDLSPAKPLKTTLKYRTGSFGLQNPSLNVQWRISPTVSMVAGAEYTFATGRYRFRYRKLFSDGTVAWDTTATRRNGDIHALRAEAAVFGYPRRGRWMAKAYYYTSARGIPGAIVNNVWKTSQRQWDHNFFLQGSWERPITDSYDIMVNAKYARDRMRYLNPDTTLMYIDNRFRQQEAYISTTHRLQLRRGWELSGAADWQWNTLHATLVNFVRPVRHTIYMAVATAWTHGPLKTQASLLCTTVTDRHSIDDGFSTPRRVSSGLTRFTPGVFATWLIPGAHGLEARAFFKRSMRMPTFNDLYYTDLGNASLRPEYVTQWNLGLSDTYSPRAWMPRLQWSVDAYHNRVRDKIIAVPKGTGQYRWMMMNIGRVRITGVDVSGSFDLSLPGDVTIHTRLTYTWQRALDYSDPTDVLDAAGTYRRQIAYIPRHSGSVAASASWRNLSLNYSWIYVGRRYENSSNIPQNLVQPWYTHDISASWRIPLRRCRLQTALEVNNLLNQQYEVIKNYPMPGRNFRLTLQIDL